MKKQITMKLRLSRETLLHLAERDLKGAVGGATFGCQPTGYSYCNDHCVTQTSCISGNGSCLTGWLCC